MQSQEDSESLELNGPIAPENSVVDLSNVKGTPPQGFFSTLGTAVKTGWDETTLPSLNAIATSQENRLDKPVRLTEQEYKDSDFFRPDVKYPGGVWKSQAEEGARRFDQKVINEVQLSQRRPGVLTGSALVIGQLAGQLLDPITLAAAVGTGGLAEGLKAASILPKIVETTRSARVAKGFARGAVEGATIATPSTLARHAADNEFGVKNTSLDVWEDIAGGAAFGGVLRGLGGFMRPMSHKANREAINTAARQAAADKSVNVKPILDNGHNEEILKNPPPNETGEVLSDNPNATDNLPEGRLDSDEVKLTEESGKIPTDRVVNTVPPDDKPAAGVAPLTDAEKSTLRARDQESLSVANNDLTVNKVKEIETRKKEPSKVRSAQSSKFMTKKLLKIARINETERTPSQVKFMKRHEQLKEIQDSGLAISQESPELQDNLIKNLKDSDEIDSLNARIESQKNKISALKENLNHKDTADEEKNILRRDIDREQHKMELAQNRKNVLEKKPSLPDKTLDAKIDTHDANMRVHDAKIKIDEGNTVDEAIQSGVRPFTKEDLAAAEDTLNSGEGSVLFDANTAARLKQKVDMTPRTEEEGVRLALEDLEANPDDPEFQQILAEKSEEDQLAAQQDEDFKQINACVRSKV